jgi:hypothetical protein
MFNHKDSKKINFSTYRTWPYVQECFFTTFVRVLDLAKDKFQGLILVPIPTKGHQLRFKSQELRFKPYKPKTLTTLVITCSFHLGEGGWISKVSNCFLVIGESKCPIAINKQIELWDAPQVIKLINMNHNRHSSSCKSLGQKCSWKKLGLKILLKQWVGATCIEDSPKNVHVRYFSITP